MKIKIIQCLKALTVLLLFRSATIHSQTVSHDFKNTINTVFAGVDLSRVPHHLLTDYAMEFVDIRSYKGVANDTNYVHKGIYTSGYNTLLMARTQTNVADLVHPDQFETNWKAARAPYTIALSGLYFKYARLREDAHPNAITVSNNKLYDEYQNGVWQNPYETDDVFMMTAPIMRYNYRNMQVSLPSNLWYSNQGAQVQSISVDFNDGNGYLILTLGQSVNLSYHSEGTYDWDYKLTLVGGQILYSHSKLIVGDQTAPIGGRVKRLPSQNCTNGTLVNGFDQVEFQGTQQFGGFANSATIQIDYIGANPCGTITNPLIVAEGFESGLLGNENPLGDNDITHFRQEARNASLNLRTEIDTYNIIYINWDQGRDDLRRNALLLEDIIAWVNATKTTTNQNVVLGQSMGGVIARYALADMEQDPNQDHDTSLYISHDAPHQGANIPISIQYLARHMADQFVSTPAGDFDLPAAGGGSVTINDIQNVFNSPGTRQLLANNIDGNFDLTNTAFTTWQTDLQAKGYPQQTRNIAISNGSHCANIQEIGPQLELLYLSGEIEPTILLDIIINYFPLLSTIEDVVYVSLAIILEDPAYLAGLLPGRTNLNARFEAKTLPSAGQVANIYKGRIRITKKINFVLFTLTYNINVTDREYDNQNTVQLPLDSYPGGAFAVPFNLSELNDSETNDWLYNLNITGRSANSFNFIPSTTSLDVGGGNTILTDPDYLRKYNAANPPTGNRAIPFHNFTTSFNNGGTNEQHISFNTRNGNWLALELNSNANDEDIFDCTYTCENTEINGLDQLCNTQNYTLSVPMDEIVIWSVSPSNLVTLSTSGSTVTVTPISNASGALTLTAFINPPNCVATTISKTIWVGKPKAFTTSPDPTICTNVFDQTPGYVLPVSPGADTYQLTSNSPNLYVDAFATPGLPINMMTAQAGNYTITLTTSNSCGTKQATIYVTAENCGGGFGSFRVMQNPVESESLIVMETDEGELNNTINNFAQENNNQQGNINGIGNEDNVTLELYDFSGNLLKTKKVKRNHLDKKYLLNVSQYDNGNYFIRITYKEIDEVYQVIFDK